MLPCLVVADGCMHTGLWCSWTGPRDDPIPPWGMLPCLVVADGCARTGLWRSWTGLRDGPIPPWGMLPCLVVADECMHTGLWCSWTGPRVLSGQGATSDRSANVCIGRLARAYPHALVACVTNAQTHRDHACILCPSDGMHTLIPMPILPPPLLLIGPKPCRKPRTGLLFCPRASPCAVAGKKIQNVLFWP